MNDLTDVKHLTAAQLCQSQALAIADIHPSPTNPRKTFPEAEMAEMIESVKRHGVMSPILVRPWPAAYAFDGERPKYELIAGERRYRAAKAAGLPYISGTVRDLGDHETLELQIVENLHRKDLNELEEAEGYELMVKRYGYTAEQLAEKIDKSKAYIYARLKLTALCEKAREAFRAGDLDASRALLIARIPTAALQQQALVEIIEGWQGPMNYRNAARHVQDKYMLKLAEAPFPRADTELIPAAGKCHPCPKRTGSNPELYPDVKSADICTDPACFAAKKAAHFARMKAEAQARGKTVIDGLAAEKLLRNGDWNIKGFVKLDSACHDAPYNQEKKGYPTYRELLVGQGTPVTLIEKADGTLLEAIEETAIKAIAADIGIKTKESQGGDKERLAKEKAENEFRRRLFDQVHGAYQERFNEQENALDCFDLRLVARQFFSCTWHEHQKRLAVLWVPSEEKIDAHERIRQLPQLLDTMPPAQISLFLIDLALIGMSHVGSYGATETPAPFLETAQRMLISPDTIRRELKADEEAKTKAKGGKQAKAVQPETTTSEALFKFIGGDIVRVKPDAVAEGGWALSSAGKPGTIVGPDEDDGWYIVKIGNGEEVLHQGTLILIASDSFTAAASQEEQLTRKPACKIETLYRHPENHDLTWSGRGRKPKWVEAWLAQDGNTLEQLAPPQRCDKTIELPGLATKPVAFQPAA